MTADEVIRLIEAVARLLGVLVWPAVVLFLLLRFGGAITEFIRNLGELNLKAPGVEATATRQREEAAAALGAAAARPSEGGALITISDPSDIAEALPGWRAARRLQGARVLWVDDRPENNRWEQQALEVFGIRFERSESTENALEVLARETYDLIISDMRRPPDARAGYTLLDRLRATGDKTPFIIYTATHSHEADRESREHGALGSTNLPQVLFSMVTDALTSPTSARPQAGCSRTR